MSSTCSVFVSNLGGHARTLTHLNFPSPLIYRRPSLVFRCTPHNLSPSRTRLRAVPLTASHPSTTLNTIARVALAGAGASSGDPAGCEPLSPSGEALAHSPRCAATPRGAGVPSRSAYADQPDIESGSASDSKTPVGFASPVQILHTRALIDANVTLTVVAPRQVAVVTARETTVAAPPLGRASHGAQVWTR